MSERPERVTVVSWILLVFSAFGLLSLALLAPMLKLQWGDPVMQQFMQTYLARIPIPLPLHWTLMGVCALISPFCAVGFLRRWGWARHLYAVTMLCNAVYGAYIMPFSPWLMLPGLIPPAAVCYCVYSAPARRWFAGQSAPPGA